MLRWADRAAAHWEAARAGARERAVAIHLRGLGHELAKDYPAAIAAYQEALALWRTLNPESVDVASGLNDLAEAERLAGDLAAAERDYNEALRIARKINYRDGIADYTGNLAELALDREQWAEAERLAREALALAEKIGRAELVGSDCYVELPKRCSARASPRRRCPSPAARWRSTRSCAIRIWTRRGRCWRSARRRWGRGEGFGSRWGLDREDFGSRRREDARRSRRGLAAASERVSC